MMPLGNAPLDENLWSWFLHFWLLPSEWFHTAFFPVEVTAVMWPADFCSNRPQLGRWIKKPFRVYFWFPPTDGIEAPLLYKRFCFFLLLDRTTCCCFKTVVNFLASTIFLWLLLKVEDYILVTEDCTKCFASTSLDFFLSLKDVTFEALFITFKLLDGIFKRPFNLLPLGFLSANFHISLWCKNN